VHYNSEKFGHHGDTIALRGLVAGDDSARPGRPCCSLALTPRAARAKYKNRAGRRRRARPRSLAGRRGRARRRRVGERRWTRRSMVRVRAASWSSPQAHRDAHTHRLLWARQVGRVPAVVPESVPSSTRAYVSATAIRRAPLLLFERARPYPPVVAAHRTPADMDCVVTWPPFRAEPSGYFFFLTEPVLCVPLNIRYGSNAGR
jgi:hypothetical protein